MAYETKALLLAIGEIVKKSKTREEIYASLSDIANAEGVILKPLPPRQESEENAESK